MTAVFSIAFNGYDKIWNACIETHYTYALKQFYGYALVGQGQDTPLAMESAWVKIPLLMAALDAGQDWVLFVDADAEFSPECPRFETVGLPDRDIYLANGFSGRPNSGVILVKNTPTARDFLKQVLCIAGQKLPRAHRVGWGENGEVIHVASKYDGFQQLDTRWNNNSQPELKDYIRHYSSGKMRQTYREWDRVKAGQNKAARTRTEHRPGSAAFFYGLVSLINETQLDPAIFNTENVLAELQALADQAT